MSGAGTGRTKGPLRRSWQSVPEFRIGWKGTLGLALLGALGRLVVPLLIRQAIDRGLVAGNVRVGYVAALCGAGFGGLLLTAGANRIAVVRLGTTSENGLAVLRERIVARILGLSLHQHSNQRRGVLVARATSDVETLSEFFSWAAIAWITNAVVMAVVGTAMLVIDWQLGLTALALSALIIPFMRVMQQRLRTAHGEVRAHVGSYLGQVAELVGSASLIRAYQAGPVIETSTIAASDRRRRANVKASAQSAVLGVGNQFIEVGVIVAVVLIGLSRTGSHVVSAGTLIGFVFLVSRFLEPLGELSEVVDQTQRAIAGITRVLDLLDLPVDLVEDPTPRPLPLGALGVNFDHVRFSYPQRLLHNADDEDDDKGDDNDDDESDTGTASDLPLFAGAKAAVGPFLIDDLNICISAGTIVAIVGATGSGKSTVARLLSRSVDPDGGVVRVGGVDLRHVAFDDLHRRVQIVAQEPFLFTTTIGANLRLANPLLTPNEQLTIFDALGIGDWIRAMPLGLDTEVGERGALLSAGERQLVVLARTRACNPDVLILDEATSSVDATTEARLAETIMALASGRTTVVIAHRLTTAARADRVLVMSDGRVVEDGTPAELLSDPDGHYARLWNAWQVS